MDVVHFAAHNHLHHMKDTRMRYAGALAGGLMILILIGFLIRTNVIGAREFSLTILHFNDLHSRLIPFNPTGEPNCTDVSICIGGVARLKTLIQNERINTEHALVLSAGDNFQGSIYFSIFKEKIIADVLNVLNVDAMVLGNHEFDEGTDALVTFIDSVDFPVLTGNVRAEGDSTLSSKLEPYMVATFDGRRVGIISAVTAKTPNLALVDPRITFEDEVDHLTANAQKLTEEGVDIIVALTHVGFEADTRIAQEVPLIDVIVGGHSDSLLSNTRADADGRYPTVVVHENGDRTLIVQTEPYGTYLGKLEIQFDKHGTVETFQGEPLAIDSTIAPEPELETYIETLTNDISSVAQEVVGQLTTDVAGDQSTCRHDTCPVGVLVTNALVSYTQEHKTSIAILNSGSIRASLASGTVTQEDLFTAIPFNNNIRIVTLTGAEILAMFEQSLATVDQELGAFLQVSGLQIFYDPTQEPDNKICTIIDTHTNTPLDLTKTYTVATNEYLAHGGDGYPVRVVDPTDIGTVHDAIAMHIATNQYGLTDFDDRIVEHCYE